MLCLTQISKPLDGLLLFECLYLAACLVILFVFKYRFALQLILLCITVSFSFIRGFLCIYFGICSVVWCWRSTCKAAWVLTVYSKSSNSCSMTACALHAATECFFTQLHKDCLLQLYPLISYPWAAWLGVLGDLSVRSPLLYFNLSFCLLSSQP